MAIPLIAKGMAEAEGGPVDMNYFLGIRQSDNRLVADFEDAATGLNHPVAGTTVIPADGTWRHAAVTYDGTTWRLYLNGALEAQLVVGAFTPRANSIQHATLGTALNSTGGVGTQPQGFFDGVLDEARIWNHARSLQQIGFGSTHEIADGAGPPRPLGLQRGRRRGPGRQLRPWRQRDDCRHRLRVGRRRAVLGGGQRGPGGRGRYGDDAGGHGDDDRRPRQRHGCGR